MKTRLGRQEMLLLAYAQMRKLRTVRTGELVEPLQLSRLQERELFRRMSRGRMIARVRPGLYLLPPSLPLGGVWSPGEAEALNVLMEDAGGRYQVCGANTFNLYGFDEQVPNRVYAYNNRISGQRTIGVTELTLIKVSDERLGDTTEIGPEGGARMVYSSRVRTLVDAVYDWSRFNGLPRAYDWIRQELKSRRVSAMDLVKCTLRYGDTGTIRRMGALLQRESVSPALLMRLKRKLKETTGLIPWVPGLPQRGTVDRRWGVVMNEGR